MKIKKILWLSVCWCFSVAVWAKSSIDANDIMARVSQTVYFSGYDWRAKARMTLLDAKGQTQSREFTIMRRLRENKKDQNFMVFFSHPSDIRDMALRVVRHLDDEDERWLYLPDLDLVRRIALADERTSFVGSDFFYEDISGRDPSADKHTLKITTEQFYVIESVAKESSVAEFSHYRSWINKITLLPMKVDYFDDNGQVYRRLESLKVDIIQGFPTTVVMRATDVIRGSNTEIKLQRVQYDTDLPVDVFSERRLKNPPRKWL